MYLARWVTVAILVTVPLAAEATCDDQPTNNNLNRACEAFMSEFAR